MHVDASSPIVVQGTVDAVSVINPIVVQGTVDAVSVINPIVVLDAVIMIIAQGADDRFI